jgi:THO complex subunit 4
MQYDRAGRSEGTAFVTYAHVADARTAIREFDGANAKGQPIRLTLLPLGPRAPAARRDNPFDRVENPKSLFDRIEAPSGRSSRRRSDSPAEDSDRDRYAHRRSGRDTVRTGAAPSRRSDMTKPPPENIDRYVPGERNGRRSPVRRGGRDSGRESGRRPGERRERGGRGDRGRAERGDGDAKMVNGRPRKTQEELDAEMEDYWGSAATTDAAPAASATSAAVVNAAPADDDIEMIE